MAAVDQNKTNMGNGSVVGVGGVGQGVHGNRLW